MPCCRRKTRQDWSKVVGRRIIPNILSKHLFKNIDFSKYKDDESVPAPGSNVNSSQERKRGWSRLGRLLSDKSNISEHEQWNRVYPSNRIKTSRYTWWNFVPISLLLQFTKVINCFYLFNTIL